MHHETFYKQWAEIFITFLFFLFFASSIQRQHVFVFLVLFCTLLHPEQHLGRTLQLMFIITHAYLFICSHLWITLNYFANLPASVHWCNETTRYQLSSSEWVTLRKVRGCPTLNVCDIRFRCFIFGGEELFQRVLLLQLKEIEACILLFNLAPLIFFVLHHITLVITKWYLFVNWVYSIY